MMAKLIYIFVILHLVFVVNAEIIKRACLQGGQSCSFSETCCSKKCIYKKGSKNNGRACMEEEDEFSTKTTSVQTFNRIRLYCLPIGTSCSSETECCSNKCETYCMPENLSEYLLEVRDRFPGYCLKEGKKCSVDSDCCSSKCNRNPKKHHGTCDSDDRKNLPLFLNDFDIFVLELKSGICQSPGQHCFMDKDCCYNKCVRSNSLGTPNYHCDVKRSY